MPAGVLIAIDEEKPGVILDYDQDGHVVSLKLLDASERITEIRRIEHQATGRSPARSRSVSV